MSGDLTKLCVHTITTKPWSLEEALDNYCAKGVTGISIWQQAIESLGAKAAGDLIRSYDIEVVSYVRGGFFPNTSFEKRQSAVELNKKLIEEAALIDSPLLVLVCGAHPDQSLDTSRAQIMHGIEALIPTAEAHGVALGIEPLHPMYAYSRSAINTLEQANNMAEQFSNDAVGVVIDVFHLWWEERLQQEIMRCGEQNNLLAYHICDWKSPLKDFLNDRELMGEGCINLSEIKSWIAEAGFEGFHEVEIFSNRYWEMDQNQYLDKIIHAYRHIK